MVLGFKERMCETTFVFVLSKIKQLKKPPPLLSSIILKTYFFNIPLSLYFDPFGKGKQIWKKYDKKKTSNSLLVLSKNPYFWINFSYFSRNFRSPFLLGRLFLFLFLGCGCWEEERESQSDEKWGEDSSLWFILRPPFSSSFSYSCWWSLTPFRIPPTQTTNS